MKDQNVLEEDWDYLIVLDACRFDTFEKVYRDYFTGNLEKRESVASSTPEWASKVFEGENEITYFSSNPFINDVGLPLNEIEWGSSCGYEWNATEHISNIIDVWHEGWDDDLGTVTPEKMNKVFRDHMNEVEESDRTVIQYMQPHATYRTKGRGRRVEQIRKSFKEAKEEGVHEESGLIRDIADKIRP